MNTLTRGDVESMLGHLLDIDIQLVQVLSEDPALNRSAGHNAHCVRMAQIATRSVRNRLLGAAIRDVAVEAIPEVVDAI
jgi:hypothetical protein